MRDGVPSGVLFPNTHVASWILFAARRVTGRFTLKVPMVPKTRMPRRYASTVPVLRYKYEDEKEEERVLLAKLPSSIKAREMSLTLGKAILTIPATGAGAFHALTGILLSHAKLDAGAMATPVSGTSSRHPAARGCGGCDSGTSRGSPSCGSTRLPRWRSSSCYASTASSHWTLRRPACACSPSRSATRSRRRGWRRWRAIT